MQSEADRRQLLKQYGEDRHASLATVLKCAAGILALIVVAAGPWLVLSVGSAASTDGQPAYESARGFPSSMAESRRIFEERRQRHQGAPKDAMSAATQ